MERILNTSNRISIRIDANTQMRLAEFAEVTGIPTASTVRFAVVKTLDTLYDSAGYLKRDRIKEAIASFNNDLKEEEP